MSDSLESRTPPCDIFFYCKTTTLILYAKVRVGRIKLMENGLKHLYSSFDSKFFDRQVVKCMYVFILNDIQ